MQQRARDGGAEGNGAVESPGCRLRKSARNIVAKVRMPNGVHSAARRVCGIGIAVAVLDPDDVAVCGVRCEGAFEVAARAEHVTGSVDVGAIRRQGVHRSVDAAVLNRGVSSPRKAGTADRVERAHAVPARAVERGELTADDDLRLVRRHDHGVDAGVSRRRPRQ